MRHPFYGQGERQTAKVGCQSSNEVDEDIRSRDIPDARRRMVYKECVKDPQKFVEDVQQSLLTGRGTGTHRSCKCRHEERLSGARA